MGAAAADRRLYIGLMSGTSMDGIDAVVTELGRNSCHLLAAETIAYPDDLREALLTASRQPAGCDLDTLGQLDHRVGAAFRDAALAVLTSAGLRATDITAIGSHGQTLRHQPRGSTPFSLQIGDPNLIAAGTGITTVADFRRRDIAEGGEGAPLAPAFHHWLFADRAMHRVVLNLGGFANVTVLPADGGRVFGFDTGPGNTLLDTWIRRRRGESFDRDGAWAASGTLDVGLLESMLGDPYFTAPPPKSTGFEYFNDAWLDAHLAEAREISAADVQATLCALTVRTVAAAIREHAPATDEVLVCGGGAHNSWMTGTLQTALEPMAFCSTAEYGLDPDWIEAVAFAWLAACRLADQPGNLPAVTGAGRTAVLGAIYAGGN